MNKDEMVNAVESEINKRLSKTAYPIYNTAIHTFALAIDILCNWNEGTLNFVANVAAGNPFGRGIKVPYSLKEEAKIFTMHHKAAAIAFEKTFLKNIEDDLAVRDQDTLRQDANELLRLWLAYVDRCATNAENADKVFKLLSELPSCNILPVSEINKFIMK